MKLIQNLKLVAFSEQVPADPDTVKESWLPKGHMELSDDLVYVFPQPVRLST